MGFQKHPDNIGKDREQDIVPVYLNKKERLWLESLKEHYGTTKDSTALKKEAFHYFLLDYHFEEPKKGRGL